MLLAQDSKGLSYSIDPALLCKQALNSWLGCDFFTFQFVTCALTLRKTGSALDKACSYVMQGAAILARKLLNKLVHGLHSVCRQVFHTLGNLFFQRT